MSVTKMAPDKLPPRQEDSPVSASPERIRRRIMVSLMAMAACAELGYATLNISCMPVFLTKTIGYPAGTMALIVGVYFLSEALFKSPMGHLSDRFGRKLFLVGGPAISIFTSLLTLLVGYARLHMGLDLASLAFIFAALRALDGLGAGMLWPVAFATMGEAVPTRQRASAMSLLNVTYMLGIAFGPLIGGTVNHLFHSDYASFYASAFLFSVAVIVGLSILPSNKSLAHLRSVSDESHPLAELESSISIKALLENARRIPKYIALSFITYFAIGIPVLVVKLFALDEYHLSEIQFGALVMPPAIAMAVLSVPVGKLADKLGRALSMQIGLGVGALGMWAISLIPNTTVVLIVACFIGLGFLISLPAWLAAISEVDPRRRGAYLGAVMACQGIGFLLGSLVGGFLYSNTFIHWSMLPWINDHYAPFLACAASLTIAFVMSLFFMKTPDIQKGENA
ncbi:MAG: MFS transporter [bacterium]